MSTAGTSDTAEVEAGAVALDLEADVLARLANVRSQWVPLAASLRQFHVSQAWIARGAETFREWLAQPEIGLAYRTAKDLIDAFDELAINRGVDVGTLATIDASKIAAVLPALRAGTVDTDTAIADCHALARSDLREKYRHGHTGVLDATTEPERCTCTRCGHSHRPRKDAQ